VLLLTGLAAGFMLCGAESRADSRMLFTHDGLVVAEEPQAGRMSRLGAPVPGPSRSQRRRSRNVHLASLGRPEPEIAAPKGSLSGGSGIRWVANAGCLADSLRSVIAHVAANFGPVTVSSTCRSHSHNRRVGGARRSYHLSGQAADFRVKANIGAVHAYLRSAVGGLKHYGGGLFHIDTGPRRPM
jgi:hypothetical protein